MSYSDVLESLEPFFKDADAESEARLLPDCFVKTDPWRRLVRGDADLILGSKGSGKSALHSRLVDSKEVPADTVLITAERPLGTSVFKQAISDRLKENSRTFAEPTIGSREFADLWQLYFLVLLVGRLRVAVGSNDLRQRIKPLATPLTRAGLLASERKRDQLTLEDTLKKILSHVSSIKMGVPLVFELGISRSGRSSPPPLSVLDMLKRVNTCLAEAATHAWILLDRLDEAFEGQSPQQEAVGLSTLLNTYVDFREHSHIKLKLFVRNDIFARSLQTAAVRHSRFDKIKSDAHIRWNDTLLMNVVLRRMLLSKPLRGVYGITEDPGHVDLDAAEARALFGRVLPPSQTGEEPMLWIHSRLSDGQNQVSPRNIINAVYYAIRAQLEFGTRPDCEHLFDADALDDGLRRASEHCYERAFQAEHPLLRDFAKALNGCPYGLTLRSLHALWRPLLPYNDGDLDATKRKAEQLIEAGFLSHIDRDPFYNVAPLYRHVLNIQDWQSTRDVAF